MTTDAMHSEQLISRYGGSLPVLSRWTYRAAEPYAVTAAFQSEPNRWVEWVFARDLLVCGLTEANGVGDVRIGPDESSDGADIVLEIESPDGLAVLLLDAGDLTRFLVATTTLVPIGGESGFFDVDALIDDLIDV